MAYAGAHDGALAMLDEERGWLPSADQPKTIGSWLMLAPVIEGLVMLGEQSQAAQLYPLAGELVGSGAVSLWAVSRFTQTIAGIAAAAAQEWEAAEEHFQIALQQAESFPNRLEQAEIRRFHAMMLMDRAALGDTRKGANTAQRSAGELHADRNAPPHRGGPGAPQLGVGQCADPLTRSLEPIGAPL
jgi:hypothetical protein